MIAAVNAGIFNLVKEVGSKPPTGKIAAISGGQVVINLGSNIVNNDDIVTALTRGEPITNPDTGEVIAYSDESAHKLRIVKVTDSASFATPIEGTDVSQLKAGDEIQTNAKPQTFEYGPAWNIKKGVFKR